MTAFLAIIVAFFKTVTAYLELKNTSFYYDCIEKSKQKQQIYENDIEKLRNVKTNAAADSADILRVKLAEERKYAEHLSAIYSRTTPGDANPN